MQSLVCVGCVNAARSTGIGRRNAALYHFAAIARYSLGRVVPSAVGGSVPPYIYDRLFAHRDTGCECNKRPIRSVKAALRAANVGQTGSQGRVGRGREY